MNAMQAAIVEDFGHELTVGETEKPTPGRGQALVKVIATGVCYTDLHALEGDWPVKPKLPRRRATRAWASSRSWGEGVTNLEVGEMVGNAWLRSACGECEHCRQGWETLCESSRTAAIPRTGRSASTCWSTPSTPRSSRKVGSAKDRPGAVRRV